MGRVSWQYHQFLAEGGQLSRVTARCLTIIAAVSLVFFPLSASGQQEEWTWEDREGQTRTESELAEILREHGLWVNSQPSSPWRKSAPLTS